MRTSRKHFVALALLAIVLGVAGTVACARALDIPGWFGTWDGTQHDECHWMIQTRDGGYALAGYSCSYGAGQADFWLVKTYPNGAIEWSQTYGGTKDDEAHYLVQTLDGGYALAGDTLPYGAGRRDFCLVKTCADGTMEWSKTYGGAKDDFARSVVQTIDHGYAIAGGTSSYGAGGYDFFLVKTDASGTMEWSQIYGGAADEEAHSVVQTSDGGYVLAGGTSSYGAGGYDFWLVKTDSNGKMLWNKTYGGAQGDFARSVIQTKDGGYALVSATNSYGAGGCDFFLVKTDENGAIEWSQTYGGTSDDFARSVVQTSDGGYALEGTTLSFGAGQSDIWLVKTYADGTMEWSKTYGGTKYDEGHSGVQTIDHGYAIAGGTSSYGAGGYDFFLVKTDASGTMEWSQTYGAGPKGQLKRLPGF